MMEKWIDWYLRSDIPKRAFLIGDEVIPLPPIPDESLEFYKSRIDKTKIRKSFEDRKRYCLNDSISIVLYAELTRNQRLTYSEYGESSDYSRWFNIDYLQEIADGLENYERNEFEEGLKSIDSASTPIDFEDLAVDDRDEYYLSISDDDERRAIMRVKGKMKPQAIKKWEEVRGFPFCSIHGIYESINRGKNKLHIPKKTRKQSNSKPKK